MNSKNLDFFLLTISFIIFEITCSEIFVYLKGIVAEGEIEREENRS